MLSQRLTAIDEVRANSQPLPRSSAPYTSSALFKTQQPGRKPPPKRWDHRWSVESRSRCGSTLKAFGSVMTPSTISLGTARPAPEYFPWESITIHASGHGWLQDMNSINLPASMSCAKGDDAFDLSVAMTYGYAAGSPQVLRFVTEHMELIHSPPYDDWESCLTCGTTSALEIVLRMFCDRGAWIMAEEYTYPGAIEAAKPLGVGIQGVRMDDKGLLPNDLDLKLRSWDPANGPKPSALYTIPSGHNPTGTTQPIERRRAIYQVAEMHDLLIIEDDPYYLLQLSAGRDESGIGDENLRGGDEYLRRLPASYLSLDVSGRVIRLDSTSKILAPGLRCGWITACSQIVKKFQAHTEFSTGAPSGPSQLMLYKLLDETLGHEGFIGWLVNLSQQYRQCRDTLLQACRRHLPSLVCHWTIPQAGMFVWIRLDWSRLSAAGLTHRLEEIQSPQLVIEDSIYMRAKENGVLISKGSWFAVGISHSSDIYFRLTFAASSEDTLDQAVERFGNALQIMLKSFDEHGPDIRSRK